MEIFDGTFLRIKIPTMVSRCLQKKKRWNSQRNVVLSCNRLDRNIVVDIPLMSETLSQISNKILLSKCKYMWVRALSRNSYTVWCCHSSQTNIYEIAQHVWNDQINLLHTNWNIDQFLIEIIGFFCQSTHKFEGQRVNYC